MSYIFRYIFFFFLESVWCSTLKSLFRLSEKISLFFFSSNFSLYRFVIFSFQCSSVSLATAHTVYHTFISLSTTFLSFFKSFFHQLRFSILFFDCSLILLFSFVLCKSFVLFFYIFFIFFILYYLCDLEIFSLIISLHISHIKKRCLDF